MQKLVQFTDTFLRNATEGYHWDPNFKSFGVRVGKNRTTFVVMIGGGRRQNVGHYPHMSLAEARKAAKKILAQRTLGKIQPKSVAFEDVQTRYLAHCKERLRASTYHDYEYNLTNYFPFGRKSIVDIRASDIQQKIDAVVPSRRRYAFATIRAFMKWCLRSEIIDANPVDRLKSPNPPKSRIRILTDEELCKLVEWLRLNDSPFVGIMGLLLYTGQRKGETSRLEWSWIDDDTVTLPSEVTKNHLEHTFPLSPSAQELLKGFPRFKDSPYVFPASKKVSEKTTVFNGWSKSKAALDRDTGITDWTLHDVRRSVASGMASIGISQIVVEKLLNHVSGGEQSAISRIYNRHHYLPEMRKAVNLWDEHLTSLTKPKSGLRLLT